MSSEHQSLSAKQMVSIENVDHFHFTVITAQWNHSVTSALEQGCIDTLIKSGVKKENIRVLSVPGSWELISAASMVVEQGNTSAVICIGAVIRGGTPHFEYICQGVTDGLSRLCSRQSIPVIYGVLTLNNMEEAVERSGGRLGNKGDEAAVAALEMVNLRRSISQNRN